MMSNKKKINLMRQITPEKSYEQPMYWWDIKGWLIFYNLSLDRLTIDVNSLVRAGNSINFHDKQTELEVYVLLLEDRHYYQHNGIDYRFIPRVIRQFFSSRRIGGVSTIEQQYVRTFLNRKERTFGRKFNEWILAWLLSHRSGKSDILRAYLSCAYFGYKLNGCDAASKKVFSKEASSLTRNEAALIASLLVYPLPAKVIDFGKIESWFPVNNIDDFFYRAELITPIWARRMRRRWQYALNLIHETK